MSLLRSYSFSEPELSDKVLSLFTYLLEHPEYKCTVAYDILYNALEGRVNLDNEFNLVGYEKKVLYNNRLEKCNRGRKELSYDTPISDDTDCTMKDTIKEPSSPIDDLNMSLMYADALEFIKKVDMYSYLSPDNTLQFVNLAVCLRQALKGYPKAVSIIKIICDTDNTVKEHIETILTHGIDDDFKNYLEEVS